MARLRQVEAVLTSVMARLILVGSLTFFGCSEKVEEMVKKSSNQTLPNTKGQVDDGTNVKVGDNVGDVVKPEEQPVKPVEPKPDGGKVEEKPIPLPGLPNDVAGYEKWLKLNAKPIPPRAADPHNGDKNIYVNQARATIAPGGQQKFPYPEGSIVVKEATRPGKDFIGLIAIMRKIKGTDPAHNDWMFVEYVRDGKDDAFREIAKGAICWGCHIGAKDTDYVFTLLE
jgi:hypothetical protein